MRIGYVIPRNSVVEMLAMLLLFLGSAEVRSAQERNAPVAKGMFAQFIGVNGGPSGPPLSVSDKDIWQSISYVRGPILWEQLQPKGPTEWNQSVLEEYGKGVLKNREKGVRVLPVLAYSNPWAVRKDKWSYAADGKRYDIAPFDGRVDLRAATITELASGKSSTVQWRTMQMPPENVADWERYVERVVAFLAKPPYNVKYFQIWNEANDILTGFWYENMDAYMRTIHLPAARIIRKHGAKVVYGGYPCNGNMPHFLGVLDKHNAWDTLDVLDIHYFRLGDWQQIYDRVKKKSRPLGIWQTEVGFTTTPDWVPNNFPRFFHWALAHDWRPDRYKIFQFPYWSPDDPKAFGYNTCLVASERYTFHGNALKTLGRLLSGPVVKGYSRWKTTPPLQTDIDESRPSVEGFRCGNRIVLAVHLPASQSDLCVAFDDIDARRVSKAYRVGGGGVISPLTVAPMPKNRAAGGVQLRVPTHDAAADKETENPQGLRSFYVALELSP